MSKLEFYQQIFPDAVEYLAKNQSYIREHQASYIAYGMKEVTSKVLFYRDIQSTSGVTQHYIFSERASVLDERQAYRNELLLAPYH